MSEGVVDQVERIQRPLPSWVCRRCNRRLSASVSVQNGMGRVCRMKAGVEPEQLKLGLLGEEETAVAEAPVMVIEVYEEESELARLREQVTTLSAMVEELERLAYLGEHHFPDLTWKARCEDFSTRVTELEAELRLANAEVKATPLAQVQAEARVRELEEGVREIAICTPAHAGDVVWIARRILGLEVEP